MKIKLLLLFFALSQITIGQEQLGANFDNYMGINMTTLNPAGHMNTPFNWDVNLLEFDFFARTNYVFFANSSILSLLTSTEPFVYGPDNRKRDIPEEGLLLDYFDDGKERYGFANLSLMGPSLFFRLNANNSIGLITRVRGMGSVIGIPDGLSFYQFNSTIQQPQFTMEKARASVTNWSEIGLNFLHQREFGDGQLGIGVTLKYLIGHEAAYVFNEIPIELTRLEEDFIASSSGAIEFGYTSSTLTDESYQVPNNGVGLGVDLGINYTFGDGYNGSYKWKIGASILDLGAINFNQNAKIHFAETNIPVEFGGPVYKELDFLDTETALQYFSFQVFGDSSTTLVDNRFNQLMPTSISLQADYNIAPSVFITGVIVQGAPLNKNAIYKANLLAVVPRFESRWFSASLPISYYHFKKFRVGLSGRLGPLFMGTDDLGSMVTKSDLAGTDFYIGLKLNPFSSNGLFDGANSGGLIGGNSGGGRGARCYKF